MAKKQTFLEKIKVVFSPFIDNYEPPEPDPDKEGLDIEIEAVPFNHRHQGNTTPKISHNDLINVAATQHHSNANDPTTNQKAAMTGANSPSAGNVFATMTDVSGGGQILYDAVVAPSGGDYTTIQAAINAGKKTIFVRNGTYNITSAITLTDKCQIIGESKEETIINAGGNDITAIHIEGSNFYNTGNISIANGSTTVTGSGTSFSSGMIGRQILLDGKLYQISAFTDTTHITIATAYYGKGISTYNYYYIADNLSVRISNIAIGNIGHCVSMIYYKYVKDSRFENLRMFDTVGGSCIKTEYAVNNIVMNCQLSGGQSSGMLLADYSISNFIQRNVISKTSGSGITLQGHLTKYNQVVDNNFSYNSNFGMYIVRSKYNIISNNICNNNGCEGIKNYDYADYNQITNNEIKYNHLTGITISESHFCIISNNHLFDNVDDNNDGAVYIYKSYGHLINGNRIYLSNYGIEVNNSQRNCITGNYIYDPDSHGIYVYVNSDNNVLTMNYIHQAGGWGIRINAATENDSFVHGNYFLTCASGGLVDNGTATVASDNTTK